MGILSANSQLEGGGVAGRGVTHSRLSHFPRGFSLFLSSRTPFERRSSSISRHEPQPRPFARVTLFLSYFFPYRAFGKPGPSAREPFLRIRRTGENPTLRDVGRGAIARPLLSLPLPVLLRNPSLSSTTSNVHGMPGIILEARRPLENLASSSSSSSVSLFLAAGAPPSSSLSHVHWPRLVVT